MTSPITRAEQPPVTDAASVIAVRGLRFTYPGSPSPVLHGLDFAIGEGEVFGLLGPSGAGKSTTQKVLIGLLGDYSGSVSVWGRQRSELGRDLYERIGVSFEQPNHFPKLTGAENLRYFAKLYSGATEDVDELLEGVGLSSDAATRVARYSKGMQVRLSLARALLNRPSLLFLDEPTAGLDPVNARSVKERIGSLRDRGATVFLTTHNMNLADEVCDRVGLIIDGRLVVLDTPRALKLAHGRRVVRVEYREDGATRRAEFPLDGIAADPAFHAVLAKGVETIHTQETTLEDVFVRLTGRRLG